MMGLIVLDARAPLSPRGHEAAAIGIVVFIYSLIGLWVRANSLAFRHSLTEKADRSWSVYLALPDEDEPAFTAIRHSVDEFQGRDIKNAQ
jgi:hypothetical protein